VPVTRFRPFRNDDPPALVELWNQGLNLPRVVRPLSVHEFDTLVMGKIHFDPAGLIVGEREGRIAGFAHAGFGPSQPGGPSHALDTEMGTTAMLVVDPALDDPALASGLLGAAEAYLVDRGARVLYAGGQYPLNPFYWGLYGGSEFSGILSGHAAFHRAARDRGYEPVAETAILETDLSRPEPRDPRLLALRRLVRVELSEDALPAGWWQALALGLFRPTHFRLARKSDDLAVAHATVWDIASGFGVGDGRSRVGVIDVEVHPDHRRQGYGRLLLTEIARHARNQLADVLTVHTPLTNQPALGLYRGLDFEQVDTATLYRRPGGRS
jgi:ribosomal protein S18 acetylase RimI-like enzyme